MHYMRNIFEYYRKHGNRLALLCILLMSGIGKAHAEWQKDISNEAADTCGVMPMVKAASLYLPTKPQAPKVDHELIERIGVTDNRRRRNVSLYDLPYSCTANFPDYKRLAINSVVLCGAGFAALGVLQALPEDATAWNKERITSIPFWERWSTHVRKGPVWDNDNFVFNYILHPYGGAAYYMSARSSGCNILYSALYSAAVSTIFWEYGIEAFMEIPSIQDLFITPFAGAIIGESFYVLKRHIVSHGYTLFGSQVLGNIMAFLIDPVNEVIGIFAGNPCRKGAKLNDNKGKQLSCFPNIATSACGTTVGLSMSITF